MGVISFVRTVMKTVPGRIGGKLTDVVPQMERVTGAVGRALRRIPYVGSAFGASAMAAGSAAVGLVALYVAYAYALPMVM